MSEKENRRPPRPGRAAQNAEPKFRVCLNHTVNGKSNLVSMRNKGDVGPVFFLTVEDAHRYRDSRAGVGLPPGLSAETLSTADFWQLIRVLVEAGRANAYFEMVPQPDGTFRFDTEAFVDLPRLSPSPTPLADGQHRHGKKHGRR